MRGVDDLATPAPSLVVAYYAAFLRVVVCGEAFAHLPFAELESVPQHATESLGRRTPGVAREFLKAALLRSTQYRGAHDGLSP